MKTLNALTVTVVVCLAASLLIFPKSLHAHEGLKDLSNYRQYSESFASSGQPNSEHLKTLAGMGFERVVYLAYTDNDTAIVSEDRKVLDLGMDYIHIPVDFMKPSLQDFQYFAAVMQAAPEKKTLLHCQINLRASAFSFLYRVIYLDTPVEEALDDMQGVWAPNDIWFGFIKTVADHHDVDLFCDKCNWGAREMEG